MLAAAALVMHGEHRAAAGHAAQQHVNTQFDQQIGRDAERFCFIAQCSACLRVEAHRKTAVGERVLPARRMPFERGVTHLADPEIEVGLQTVARKEFALGVEQALLIDAERRARRLATIGPGKRVEQRRQRKTVEQGGMAGEHKIAVRAGA